MFTVFIILIIIAFYPYILYPLLGCCIVGIKKIFFKEKNIDSTTLPHISLLIAAYNEEDFVEEKIKNIFEIKYPNDKFEVYWVTDGSTDRTQEIIAQYPQFHLLHEKERKGKIHAIQRAIAQIKTSIIVFCDANTYLNKQSIQYIVNAFNNPKIGAVAGEKRVFYNEYDKAAVVGEGIYWKYESTLKKIDSELFTVVGAAGELFAIRKELFEPVPDDTILDDFLITLKIASKGYKIKYEPNAIASEYGSANIKEEMKRKIRIASGGFQTLLRNLWLLNIFKHPMLSFQFISHKLMRWITTPLLLLVLLPFNILLSGFYSNVIIIYLLVLQIIFYSMVITGYIIQNKNIRWKFLFVPYYFFMANMAQFQGFFRFLRGKSTVKWEKTGRYKKQ